MLASRYNKGDTLIEVLFATAIFSLLAVGAIALMNKGTATSERALEITLVRNEISSQAEALRFLNASYISAFNSSNNYSGPANQWYLMHQGIISTNATKASNFGLAGGTTCPSPPNGSFILNPKKAEYKNFSSGMLNKSVTFSQLVYDVSNNITSAQGIWIEAIRSQNSSDINQSGAGYIDFHIRACWNSDGQAEPVTLGTIVRLYEPR